MSSNSFDKPELPHLFSALSLTRDLQTIHRKSSQNFDAQTGSRSISNSVDRVVDQSSVTYFTSQTRDSSSTLLPNEIHLAQGNPIGPISSFNRPDVIIDTSGNSILPFPDLVVSGITDNSYDQYDGLQTPLCDPPHNTARVRFRSRVRITSGLNRQRNKSISEQDYLTFSSSSSVSGSPSSSISAPLRSQADDDIGKPGWGTLGQRVAILARANGQRKPIRQQRPRVVLVKGVRDDTNNNMSERTPLMSTTLPSQDNVLGCDSVPASEDESELSREIELVFGPWPNRLTNPHWWWWKMEPIVYCQCLDESDDDG